MNYFYIPNFLLLLISCFQLTAQETISISMGSAYSNQTFFNLQDGSMTSISMDAWDLAFNVSGQQGSGISLNEGSALGGTAITLYLSEETDFSTTIDASTLTNLISNDETGWEEGAALSSVKDSQNPFDIGWGIYDPATHVISGNKIFVLQLRDGSYKKFMISSLDGGIYTMKYADLDGSNEQTATVDKADFSNTDMAFFSFNTGSTISTPDQWDLLFTRYSTIVPDGEGGFAPYTVTGVLSAYGIETVEIDAVTPSDIDKNDFYDTYGSQLGPELDIIGYDWKQYTGSWSIATDRVYLIKNEVDDVYKINFIDFEGSSSGVSVLEYALLTNTTSTSQTIEGIESLSIFPNPVKDMAQITFQSDQSEIAQIQLFDISGKFISKQDIQILNGANQFSLDMDQHATGQYILLLESSRGTISNIINKK